MHRLLLPILLVMTACTSEMPEEAKAPAQGREQAPSAEPTAASGIDVSHFQGKVDWAAVEKAGIRFAFAKATQGAKFVDPRFAENWKALGDTKITRGAYHFLEPDVDGTVQAKHFLANVKLAPGDLLPVVDVETKGPRLFEVLGAYLAEVKAQLGIDAIIYVSPAFWNEHLAAQVTSPWPNPLWIAEYGVKEPKPTTNIGPWVIWQYDSKGRVPGVEGNVDRDRTRALETVTIR